MIELRRALLPALVLVAGAAACTVSENRYPLPLSANDANKAWAPLMQCATQRGYHVQDGTQKSPPRVDVFTDASNLMQIAYTVDGDHLSMDVVVWGDATDADRARFVEDLKTKGNDVWACAQQNGAR